jgi:hypothetical protein
LLTVSNAVMTNDITAISRVLAVFAILAGGASLCACAGSEPRAVRHAAIRQLGCSPDDVYAFVNRRTSKVDEWYAGCDFKYLRVHCGSEGGAGAGPRPPCLGEGECFEEDPLTFEWRLVQNQRGSLSE